MWPTTKDSATYYMTWIIEFTQAMDNPQTMATALAAKTLQYTAAAKAICRAQETLSHPTVTAVSTIPFIFGARGAVLAEEFKPLFRHLGLN